MFVSNSRLMIESSAYEKIRAVVRARPRVFLFCARAPAMVPANDEASSGRLSDRPHQVKTQIPHESD